MSRNYERIWNEGRDEGLSQGLSQGSVNAASMLIRLGKNTLEDIAHCCSLSLEEVQKLADSLNSNSPQNADVSTRKNT